MADKYSWSNATNYDVGNADGVKGNVTQWSRSTVADGKWLNQETILPMSGRDQYLLDSLNDVDDDVESCVDRIELLETSATDHENRLQQMQLEIDGKQDLLTSNNAGFGIQINQEESEGVPSHPVIAVYAHNTDNITVHSQQGSTSVGFALNEDISVNSITALENGEGKKITGFNAVYTESIGLQNESDSITTEEIINGLTNTVSLQGSKSISISEPDSSNVSNVSVITHKTGTTEDGGLSVDDSGLKVNVDNSSIQITSNAIEAKLSSTGAIEKTDSNGGLGVKVDNSSIQISSNTIGAKLSSTGAIEKTDSNGGLGVKVDNSSIQITSNAIEAKLSSTGAIEKTDSNGGLGVKVDNSSIQISSNTIGAKLKTNGGLEKDTNGIGVKVDGTTITINDNGNLASSVNLPTITDLIDKGAYLGVTNNAGDTGSMYNWINVNTKKYSGIQNNVTKSQPGLYINTFSLTNTLPYTYYNPDSKTSFIVPSVVYSGYIINNQTGLDHLNQQKQFNFAALLYNNDDGITPQAGVKLDSSVFINGKPGRDLSWTAIETDDGKSLEYPYVDVHSGEIYYTIDISFDLTIEGEALTNIKNAVRVTNADELCIGRFTYDVYNADKIKFFTVPDEYIDGGSRYFPNSTRIFPTGGSCVCLKGSASSPRDTIIPCSVRMSGYTQNSTSYPWWDASYNGNDTSRDPSELYICMNIAESQCSIMQFIGTIRLNVLCDLKNIRITSET